MDTIDTPTISKHKPETNTILVNTETAKHESNSHDSQESKPHSGAVCGEMGNATTPLQNVDENPTISNTKEDTLDVESSSKNDFKTPVIMFKMPGSLPEKLPMNKPKEEGPPQQHKLSKTIVKPSSVSKQPEPQLPYLKPPWSGLCKGIYSLDVLKCGKIIDNVDLTSKECFVFGRLKMCDVPMDHPSLSRYHAVVQYCCKETVNRDIGWYLYDLGSTHGTWVNKRKVDARIYIRLKVGYMIKFGGSSRLFILQGPDDDTEEESELTITEMKQKKEREKLEAELRKPGEEQSKGIKKDSSDEGCSWGLDSLESEDPEIDPDAPNPFALDAHVAEELFLDDPKKTLRGYFEREGLDMPEYEATELGYGKHKCTVELPIDDATGRPIVAEATVTGKKKESVIACALEACRILDRHGELRKSAHESRQRKSKNWEENDFYDSDDDTFLDRTGDIERKRQQRMKRLGKEKEAAMSYETITTKLGEIEQELSDIQKKLDDAKSREKSLDTEAGGLDILDAFMANIKGGAMDTKTKMALKRRMFDLKKEQAKLERLANIARPVNVPLAKSKVSPASLPMFGKRKIPTKKTPLSKVPAKSAMPVNTTRERDSEEEEDEDSGEESTPKKVQKMETQTTSGEATSAAKNAQSQTELAEKYGDDSHEVSSDKAEVTETKSDMNELSKCENDESLVDDASFTRTETEGLKPAQSEAETKRLVADKSEPDASSCEVSDKTNGDETAKGIDERRTVKGPSLPPWLKKEQLTKETCKDEVIEQSSQQNEGAEKGPGPKKRKRQRKKPDAKISTDYSSTDPDYAVWLPPQNQSGDGKTHLNEKFGY